MSFIVARVCVCSDVRVRYECINHTHNAQIIYNVLRLRNKHVLARVKNYDCRVTFVGFPAANRTPTVPVV